MWGWRCTLYLLWRALLWFIFSQMSTLIFSNSSRQFMHCILLAQSELKSFKWALFSAHVQHVKGVFGGHHSQIARYRHMSGPCQLPEQQHMLSLCYQARDWFLCPSWLPFPLCFKAQFREAYDVLTCAPWITPLKDASAQSVLQKWIGSVLSFVRAGCCRSEHVLIVRQRVMSRRDEANAWQPNVWLQQH